MSVNSLSIASELPEEMGHVSKPSWHLDDLVTRKCPVCECVDATPFVKRPDGLIVCKCVNCSMLFIREIPSGDQIREFYEQYGRFKGFNGVVLTPLWSKVQAACDPYLQILAQTGGIRGKNLVEFGCSYGRFLQLCRARGARATGIEIDSLARGFVDKMGFDVYSQVPTTLSADIVCAFDVLEHLADLGTTIALLSKMLSPKGRILLSVPNGGEVSWWGAGWIGFRLDLEHLNYFNPLTLALALEKQALILEQVWFSHQPDLSGGTRDRSLGDRVLNRLSLLGQPFRKGLDIQGGSYNLVALARKS